jgi:hypothetical protein
MLATPAPAATQTQVTPPPVVVVQAPPSNDLVEAAVQLQERLASARADSAPMLTNAGAPLVRKAFDRDALRAMPLDLRALGGTCSAIGKTLIAYMQFAQRTTGGKDANPAAANRQALRMQDEVSLGLAAGNICVQRSFRAAEALINSSEPTRPDAAKEGLKQMRQGAAMAIRGSLDSVTSTGLSPRNRDIVLSAILEDAPAVAASFPQSERNALRAVVLARVPKVTGTDRVKMQAIAKAYGSAACNAVCRLGGTN